MKPDKLIAQRFEELEKRAEELLRNKKLNFVGNDNVEYFKVNYAEFRAWAARRNNAAHGNWTAYNNADVEDLIRGVTRLIANYL